MIKYFSSLLFLFLLWTLCLHAESFRVLGLGSPCVDYVIPIKEEDLELLNIQKGGYLETDPAALERILGRFDQKTTFTGDCVSNTLRGLAHLGISCATTGRVTSDLLGKKIQSECAQLQITTHFIETDSTSQMACLMTPDGEQTLCAFVKPELEMSGRDLKPELFDHVDLVHMEGRYVRNGTFLEKAMELAEKNGCTISIHLTQTGIIATYRERILALLEKYVDILFLNEREAFTLTHLKPKAAAQFLKNYCHIVVVTVAEQGCWVASDRILFHAPAIPVEQVIDTNGASNLFASAFLYGYLHHYSLRSCARFGNLVGAAAVEHLGTDLPLAKWEELKGVMRKRQN